MKESSAGWFFNQNFCIQQIQHLAFNLWFHYWLFWWQVFFFLPISIPHTLPHSLCLHVSLCFTAPHPHPTPHFLSILSSLSLLGWYRRNWSLSGVKHRDSLEVQTELLLPRWGSAKIPVLLECSRDEKHTNLNTQTLKIQGHGMGSVGNMVRINCKNSRINPPTMTFPPPH